MPGARIFAFLMALSLTSPTLAGSLYLTGHDTLDHDGQEGYWLVIIDYLRGAGTPAEIAVADYDIVVLCTSGCSGPGKDMLYPSEMVTPGPWTGPETQHDPTTLDDAGWTDVFSHDLVIVIESNKLEAAGRDALNARSAELEAYFDAGGDLWMNSSSDATDYYTVLPPSVLSVGTPLPDNTNSGFTASVAGVAIGLTNAMVNGHNSHNTFSSAAPGLTVFERHDGNQIMSIGARDVTITEITRATVIPTLSTWAMILLVFLVVGLAYPVLRAKRH